MRDGNADSGIIFDEDLVILNLNASNREEVLRKIAGKLIDRGYVKPDFINALMKREREFPTGIKTNSLGVAIPHTDIEYVNQASLIIGVLNDPVIFKQMVSDEEVAVNIVFMLAINDPDQQLTMLQKIVAIIQDDALLNSIYKATSKTEIASIIKGACHFPFYVE